MDFPPVTSLLNAGLDGLTSKASGSLAQRPSEAPNAVATGAGVGGRGSDASSGGVAEYPEAKVGKSLNALA